MAKKKICGIYCIRNLINGKRYIGQSIDICKRWIFHKWELNNNCHVNSHLQRAWNKYGEENFEFIIIELCTQEELNQKEIFWIEKFDSHKNGYNLNDGGDGNLRKEWTDEQIECISNPIFQIDLDGNVIKRWPSTNSAAKELNINARQIWNCVNKHISKSTNKNGERYLRTTKTAGGYIWVYERDIGNFDINYYMSTKSIPVRQYDLNWNLIKVWPSVRSTKEVGYDPSTISDVCGGKFKKAYGYIWTYDNINLDSYIDWYNDYFDIKYIGQYDENLNLIKIWHSVKETEIDGFKPNSVSSVLNGRKITHYGYIFKYIHWTDLRNMTIKGEILNEYN